MGRNLYRAPGDGPVRPVASGHQNLVRLGAIMPTYAGIYEPYPIRTISRSAPACPAWGCGPAPIRVVDGSPLTPINPWFGATSTVVQPPPSTPQPSASVSNPLAQPLSPAPAPTVAVSDAQTAPSLTQPGTTLDSSGNSATVAPTGIAAWLSESTVISGFPNWGILGVAAAALWMMSGKAGRR